MLAVLLTACASFALSQILVLPTLPTLARHHGATSTATSWVLTGFLLSASIATPVVGTLGERYGKGQVLNAVLLVFSVGAVVSALAPSLDVLIAGRVLQRAAGGVFPWPSGGSATPSRGRGCHEPSASSARSSASGSVSGCRCRG